MAYIQGLDEATTRQQQVRAAAVVMDHVPEDEQEEVLMSLFAPAGQYRTCDDCGTRFKKGAYTKILCSRCSLKRYPKRKK